MAYCFKVDINNLGISMENMPLSNSVKCEALVQKLAEEFVKTLPEGVANLFNYDAFKEESLRLFFSQKVLIKNPEYNASSSIYYRQPEFISTQYTLFEALMAEYTFPLFYKAIRELMHENKDAIVDEIKQSMREVGVLSHVMRRASESMSQPVRLGDIDATTIKIT